MKNHSPASVANPEDGIMTRFFLGCLLLVASALPAWSEIYTCPDGKGGLIFKDKPCAGSQAPKPPPAVASNAEVWCISPLKVRFPTGVKIHGIAYPLNKLLCLPQDITNFTITAGRKNIGLGPAFAVEGSLTLGAISPPFKVFDGAQGKKYSLHLQTFLISPEGQVVWEQQGFPQGGSWISADGATVRFMLINAYSGPTKGYRALILAAGDPILSGSSETRVILGLKEVILD